MKSAELPPPIRPAYSVLSNDKYEKVAGRRMCGWKESADAYLESLRTAKDAVGEGS